MRLASIALIALGALAACNGPDDRDSTPPAAHPSPSASIESPAGPDLAACEARQEAADDAPASTEPVTVPPEFAAVAKASPRVLAVSTTSGASACADLRWVGGIDDMEWLQGDRLLGWSWDGYEAFGYQVVDRQGAGAVVETGAKPAFSRDARRFAAVQVDEAGFGGLGGFGVWEAAPDGLKKLGGDGLGADGVLAPVFRDAMGDWQVVAWAGNACVNLSFAPWDSDIGEYDQDRLQPFHAAEGDRWHLKPGACS